MSEKGYTEVYDDTASFGLDYEVIIKSDGHELSLAKYSSEIRKSRYSNTSLCCWFTGYRNEKEGTIILNIMDLKSGYLIWIGYADAVVVDKENRGELLQEAVSNMLDKFPPE